MKIKLTLITATGVISGLSLGPFNVAQAIEPPPDDAQPPAALREDDGAELSPAVKQESSPFIGLATATLPGMVAEHLDIEAGTGVIIRTVCPDSPAEKAGLSVNDIILKIDGAEVGNPEAVASAIRDHKVGDRLSVDLIHKGKPSKVEVKLGERPADLTAQIGQEPLMEGIPEDHADRLRGLIEQNLGAFGNGGPNGAVFPDAQFENTFRLMRERMNKALGEAPEDAAEAGKGIQFQQSSTIRMMDNDGSIEIKSSGDSTEVTIRDTDNGIVWTGPWDTEQDKAAAPADIRERVEKINGGAGKGFTFRFGKLKPKPDAIEN